MEERRLSLAKAGDQQARGELIEALYGVAMGYLMKLTLHRDAAEDLARETLVRALRALPMWRGDGAALDRWILSIAHSVYRERARSRTGLPAILLDEPLLDEVSARGVRALETLEKLAGLSPERRAGAILWQCYGYSSREVAAILGVVRGGTSAGDRWADPLPPEGFAPAPEAVAAILDRAAQPAPRAQRPMPGRWVGGLTAALVLLAIVAFGARAVGQLWGDTVLPRDGSGATPTRAATEATPEPSSSPTPTAEPTPAQAAVSDFDRIFGGHGSVTLGDLAGGLFTGRQSLRGELIREMPLEAEIAGQALVCATLRDGAFTLPEGPCVLQVYEDALYGYDRAGELVYTFSGIRLEQIVERLLQEGQGDE